MSRAVVSPTRPRMVQPTPLVMPTPQALTLELGGQRVDVLFPRTGLHDNDHNANILSFWHK